MKRLIAAGSGRASPAGAGHAGRGGPARRRQGARQAHRRRQRHHAAVQLQEAGRDHVVGYDLDLVHAVAKRLGVAVETVSVSSAERIPMLKDGKLDFVATSMTRTPERLKDIDFSYIYFVTPHAVIVKKSSGITSVHQLAGKKASSASTSTAGGNLKEVVPERRARLCARLRHRLRHAQGRQGRRLPDRRDRAARDRAAGRPARRLSCSFRTSPSRATSASP